jgi:hypothetical protein
VNLEGIERFVVPESVVEQTVASLRDAGEEGFERFVLWSGVADGSEMTIRTAHVPTQTAYRTRRGLMVRVEGEALHRLNSWLYMNREILAAQVHAHPTDAFHSGTDDEYPIVTALGGLSLVVPDFAARGFFVRGLEAYRLTPRGWRRIGRSRFRRLVKVV